MARLMGTVLAGVLVSTLGYFALHFVNFPSSAHPQPNATTPPSAPPVTLTSLPAPVEGISPPIRVGLTEKPTDSLTLQIDGPFTIQTVGREQPLGRGTSLKASPVKCAGPAIRIGDEDYRSTRLEIVPENSPAIWVNDHQYRGSVRLYRQPGGKLLAVNVLPLEDYIASVVDSEMPAAFPPAARRAQAICARTYARYQMSESRSHPYFDVFSTTRSQNYLGYQYLANGRRLAGETAEGRRMAQETAGLVCVYEGEVFCTYYSAVCGGSTVQGDLVFRDAAPPLQPVACDWCRDAGLYRWTKTHTRQAAASRLAARLGASAPLMSLHRTDDKPLTPASLFRASNGQKSVQISAVDLKHRLSLPSTVFEVWQDAEHFHFQGRGHGHGVGLCQWGARGLALAGQSTAEILTYYYPGAQITALPE